MLYLDCVIMRYYYIYLRWHQYSVVMSNQRNHVAHIGCGQGVSPGYRINVTVLSDWWRVFHCRYSLDITRCDAVVMQSNFLQSTLTDELWAVFSWVSYGLSFLMDELWVVFSHGLAMGCIVCLMTSSNWDIFCITGPLCGEFTGHRWILLTTASDAELW